MQKIRVLVTGGTGFVGKYLISLLNEVGGFEISLLRADLRDREGIEKDVKDFLPDYVFHLAAQPFIPKAIEDPWETEDINVKGTLNLLENLHQLGRPVRMLYISSADIYGRQSVDALPLNEVLIPNPINPYSGSKLAAESYCRQYAAYDKNLSILIARPFNHIGVGQRSEFVIPNFCLQIIEARKKSLDYISVGDLLPTRDFSNVKDIVRGYLLLIEKGVSGEVYNLCSGIETSILTMVETLVKISGRALEFREDSARLRGSESSRIVGDNRKIKKLGWAPQYSIEETLTEIYTSLLD